MWHVHFSFLINVINYFPMTEYKVTGVTDLWPKSGILSVNVKKKKKKSSPFRLWHRRCDTTTRLNGSVGSHMRLVLTHEKALFAFNLHKHGPPLLLSIKAKWMSISQHLVISTARWVRGPWVNSWLKTGHTWQGFLIHSYHVDKGTDTKAAQDLA